MPTVRDRDKQTLDLVERFMQTARDEIDGIGGWRDADPGDRFHQFWVPMMHGPHRGVIGETTPREVFDLPPLMERIIEFWPAFDARPFQSLRRSILRWHRDKNADHIPDQGELEATLEDVADVLRMVGDRIVAAADHQAGEAMNPTAAKQGEATIETAAEESAGAFMQHREIAKLKNVDPEALRKRLDRFRRNNLDGYIENTERGP